MQEKLKMIVFKDVENNMDHIGVMTPDKNIICSCCGGLIESDDVGKGKNEIIKEYDSIDTSVFAKFFSNTLSDLY